MSLQIRRLNHVTLNAPAGEEAKVRHFFGEILGLKEVELPPALTELYEIVWFELGEHLLHIEFTHHYQVPVSVEEKPGIFMPGRHFAIEVKDIAGVRKNLTDHGITIDEAVTIDDRDRFYIPDPFGNIIELIEFHKDQ